MMGDWLLTNTPLLTYLAHAPNLTNTYARDKLEKAFSFLQLDRLHRSTGCRTYIYILLFVLFLHGNDMETLLLAGM